MCQERPTSTDHSLQMTQRGKANQPTDNHNLQNAKQTSAVSPTMLSQCQTGFTRHNNETTNMKKSSQRASTLPNKEYILASTTISALEMSVVNITVGEG